jgi:hypothetical protein
MLGVITTVNKKVAKQFEDKDLPPDAFTKVRPRPGALTLPGVFHSRSILYPWRSCAGAHGA